MSLNERSINKFFRDYEEHKNVLYLTLKDPKTEKVTFQVCEKEVLVKLGTKYLYERKNSYEPWLFRAVEYPIIAVNSDEDSEDESG